MLFPVTVRRHLFSTITARLTLFAVTTAVFATCGMSIWTFMLAAFLTLPKQFITVYLGVALEDSKNGQLADPSPKAKFALTWLS